MIHLEILPPSQRAFWDEEIGNLPRGWVLYGGTAIALQLGHRQSLDFDLFSSDSLDRKALRSSSRCIAAARTIQDEPDTLTVIAEKGQQPIKVSFFGGIKFGRVGEPILIPGKAAIASLVDLFGTKLATVTQRIEARDYLDIAAILASGVDINDGVAALLALYGEQASGAQSIKTMTWFKDGGLEAVLPEESKKRLMAAAKRFDPATQPLPKRSSRLD